MDGVFVIFAALPRLGFVQKGGGSNCVKAGKSAWSLGTGQESKARCMPSCPARRQRVVSIDLSQTLYMTIQRPGCLFTPFSIFGLMYFSFPLTAI